MSTLNLRLWATRALWATFEDFTNFLLVFVNIVNHWISTPPIAQLSWWWWWWLVIKQFEMQINPRLTSATNTLEGRSQTLLPGVAMMMMMMMTVMMMMVMVMRMVMFGDDDSNDDTWRFMKIPRDSWKIQEKKNKSDIICSLILVSPLPRMLLIFSPLLNVLSLWPVFKQPAAKGWNIPTEIFSKKDEIFKLKYHQNIKIFFTPSK